MICMGLGKGLVEFGDTFCPWSSLAKWSFRNNCLCTECFSKQQNIFQEQNHLLNNKGKIKYFRVCRRVDSHSELLVFTNFQQWNVTIRDCKWALQLWFAVQYQQNDGRCGVCGDSFGLGSPRPHEAGGQYAKGIIGRHYSMGQVSKLL